MSYKRKLVEMSHDELNTCIEALFRSHNTTNRTRDQKISLLLSWLDAMSLTPYHEFLFYRDENNDLWLLNRDQVHCKCCRGSPPTKTSPQRSQTGNKSRVTYQTITVPENRDNNTNQVTVVTQQPQRNKPGVRPIARTSPQQTTKKEEEPNCCRDCCSECAHICSNFLSG
ncbi:hypothetical protein M3Y94_00328900 [Aphelenchoides besseyi]|nr:hypothetical protein M3Y94_00328900 [Aphelenchoides besseyi]KAI6235572.1 hypothetical protein M3Y95_00065700 [Aphelenchoides besseyi]